MDKGFPKGGGGGGGADIWEKFPNNVVFFFEGVPKKMIDWLFVAWTFTSHACSVFDRHLELGSNLQSESAIRICN